MKALRTIPQILGSLLLLMIVVANGYFYYRVFSNREIAAPPASALADSLRAMGQKRLQFQDSLTYYKNQHEILTAQKDSVRRLDSLGRAGLRARYRTSIRDSVAKKLRERPAR